MSTTTAFPTTRATEWPQSSRGTVVRRKRPASEPADRAAPIPLTRVSRDFPEETEWYTASKTIRGGQFANERRPLPNDGRVGRHGSFGCVTFVGEPMPRSGLSIGAVPWRREVASLRLSAGPTSQLAGHALRSITVPSSTGGPSSHPLRLAVSADEVTPTSVGHGSAGLFFSLSASPLPSPIYGMATDSGSDCDDTDSENDGDDTGSKFVNYDTASCKSTRAVESRVDTGKGGAGAGKSVSRLGRWGRVARAVRRNALLGAVCLRV